MKEHSHMFKKIITRYEVKNLLTVLKESLYRSHSLSPNSCSDALDTDILEVEAGVVTGKGDGVGAQTGVAVGGSTEVMEEARLGGGAGV